MNKIYRKYFFIVVAYLFLPSCTEHYIKNKFEIKSFSVKPYTADKFESNYVLVNFEMNYFSDSTYSNYFDEGIEKGQDGSNFNIVYFGIPGVSCSCDSSMQKFINSFNKGEADFIGQQLEKPKIICFLEPCQKYSILKNIILVKQNKLTKQLDTLKCN